jgi:hypothetical protein
VRFQIESDTLRNAPFFKRLADSGCSAIKISYGSYLFQKCRKALGVYFDKGFNSIDLSETTTTEWMAALKAIQNSSCSPQKLRGAANPAEDHSMERVRNNPKDDSTTQISA